MKRMSIESKKKWIGFSFILPWVIGFFFLYLLPLIRSFAYSFNFLQIVEGGLEKTYVGIQNYKDAFLTDEKFTKSLVASLSSLGTHVVMILVFSMIIALILNQDFRGKSVARAIFFIPVIIASGVIIHILSGDIASHLIKSGEKSSSIFKITMFQQLLLDLGLTNEIVSIIINTVNNIFELSWKSGVQILLFLAGLQSISVTLYEAAEIDGSTAWEKFWKITFPILSPVLLVNLIYTITDTFTSYTNQTMILILDSGKRMDFAYSSTLAWIYFSVIVLVLGIVFLLSRRQVSYLDT